MCKAPARLPFAAALCLLSTANLQQQQDRHWDQLAQHFNAAIAAIMSVKRKPVFCSCCSMDITNTLRIRCAQLGPPPQQQHDPDASLDTDKDAAAGIESGAATRKHESLDVLHSGPRSDGLVPVCDEFDICGSCFCEGKEMGKHKRWHDYRVVVSACALLNIAHKTETLNHGSPLDTTRIPHIHERLGSR